MTTPAPIPMFLTCPMCSARHIDEGVFATKPHHTHSCQSCGLSWRPAIVPTVGVQFLPGFKNVPTTTIDVGGKPVHVEHTTPDERERANHLRHLLTHKPSSWCNLCTSEFNEATSKHRESVFASPAAEHAARQEHGDGAPDPRKPDAVRNMLRVVGAVLEWTAKEAPHQADADRRFPWWRSLQAAQTMILDELEPFPKLTDAEARRARHAQGIYDSNERIAPKGVEYLARVRTQGPCEFTMQVLLRETELRQLPRDLFTEQGAASNIVLEPIPAAPALSTDACKFCSMTRAFFDETNANCSQLTYPHTFVPEGTPTRTPSLEHRKYVATIEGETKAKAAKREQARIKAATTHELRKIVRDALATLQCGEEHRTANRAIDAYMEMLERADAPRNALSKRVALCRDCTHEGMCSTHAAEHAALPR